MKTRLPSLSGFISQFGAAILAAQEAMARAVEEREGTPYAPNLLLVSIDRETFIAENRENHVEALETFRADMTREAEHYAEANGWTFTGPLSVNLLLRSIATPTAVRVVHAASFATLTVRDDRGTRTVAMRAPMTVVGRAHTPAPRSFIAVEDGSRSLSREHVVLRFHDGILHATLRGRNTTTLNDETMEPERDYHLSTGDTIACGACDLTVAAVAV